MPTPEPQPEPEPLSECTPKEWAYIKSKAQILGLITRIDNLLTNQNDAKKAFSSVSSMYTDPQELKQRLVVLRQIVNEK